MSWPGGSAVIIRKFVPKDKLDETLHSFDSFHPLGRIGTIRDLTNTNHIPSRPVHQLGYRRDLGGRRRRRCRTELDDSGRTR